MARRRAMRGRALGLVLCLSVPGCSADKATSSQADISPIGLAFFTEAFDTLEFDRLEGEEAVKRAKTPEVRDEARQLLQRAAAFDALLRPVAYREGVRLPKVLHRDLRVRVERLRMGQGGNFDRAFIEDQIRSHQDVLDLAVLVQGRPDVDQEVANISRQAVELVKQDLARLRGIQGRLLAGSKP